MTDLFKSTVDAPKPDQVDEESQLLLENHSNIEDKGLLSHNSLGEQNVLKQPKISPDHSDMITEDLDININGKVFCPIHYGHEDPSEMFGLTCGH